MRVQVLWLGRRKAREGARFSPLHGAPGVEDGDEEEVMKKINDGELLDRAVLLEEAGELLGVARSGGNLETGRAR
jgi:hypothetical protein